MKFAALYARFAKMTPDELKRERRRMRLKVIITTLAMLVAISTPYMAKHLRPDINSWMWPPIPKLAETDVPGGLRFDGKDDYVKVGPFDLSSPQYTLEAFVTSAGDGDNGVIALLKNEGHEPEMLHLYDGYPAKERQSGAGIIGQRPYQNVNAPLVNNTREHRAVVVDGQVMHYFVNGTWQGKRYCTARKGLMWQMRELFIGCKANETEFFRGQIDQVRLSKIARYSNNFAPVTSVTSDDSTLALYNFEEGEGDVLKDASGNGRDGKIIGATWADRSRSRKTSAEPGEDVRSLTTSATASKFPPLAPGWFERVSKLPPEEQVKEVAAELKRRNPEWDEKLEYEIRDDCVRGMKFDSSQLVDITRLSVLSWLQWLRCPASNQAGPLTDLSPLAGLKNLGTIDSTFCKGITDLSPLAGKPIIYLRLNGCVNASDLSPLQGSSLHSEGAKDEGYIGISSTGIRDLNPLRDSKVQTLSLWDMQFDPDIVCRWPLHTIYFGGTVQKVPREKLLRLKEIKTLERIDDKPVAEFWKEFEK